MNVIFVNINHDVGYESSESIPISLGYILAYLQKNGCQGIILDDLQDRPLSLKDFETWINRVQPRVIGFTAYQSTMNRIRFYSRYIKSKHPEILIVLGGPQIVGMPSSALEHLPDIDALIHGEGESTILSFVRAIENNDSLRKLPGLSGREDGIIFYNPEGSRPTDDLDDYPSPYLTGILNVQGKDTAILLSSRGCRHNCLFCITPGVCNGNIRYHSIARVVEEMESLSEEGIQRFWFADPNFTENKQRTLELLNEKIRHGVTTPFWLQTRSDLVDEEIMDALKAAGADTLAFGLESGSPEVLKKTKKGISLERVEKNIAYAQSIGLETELFTIFGLPGETVDDARATISFVKSLNVPVESNSGSQQMQLYFGSAYERNCKDYGYRPFQKWRPNYLSIGDQYETDTMDVPSIKKVRNLWALANEQLNRDVYYKQRVFEALDFLLAAKEDLKDEPEYFVLGTLASNTIEEFDLLKVFLTGFRNLVGDEDAVSELISGLLLFHETDLPSGPSDRIIFDSRSYIGGVPFTGISGKYWDVLLGKGLLLPSFEEGLVGAKAGQDIKFEFGFPEDYYQEELQGKMVEIHAKVHKVFNTFQPESVEDVIRLAKKNHYDFQDLDFLRSENEILYYFCLRDADHQALLKTPRHFLALTQMMAKLDKLDEVDKLASLVTGKVHALNAVADTLAGSGKFHQALKYYESMGPATSSNILKRARVLLKLGQPKKAYGILKRAPQSLDPDFQETLLECLKNDSSDGATLSALENHVMNLRVLSAIERESLPKPGKRNPKPVVHGALAFDE